MLTRQRFTRVPPACHHTNQLDCLYQQTRRLQSRRSPPQGPLQPHLHHTCCFLWALLTSFRPSGAVSALWAASTDRLSGLQGCCVQGRRRFGTQDRAPCRGAEGHSSIRPEDPGTLLLPQLLCYLCSQITDCRGCIWSGRAPTFICSSHAAVCTRPFGYWTQAHLNSWTTQLNRLCCYPHHAATYVNVEVIPPSD